jgi:hypothetical protein
MVTNLSNVLPMTLLVGISVNTVALADAIAAVPVDVYWTWANAVVRRQGSKSEDRILMKPNENRNHDLGIFLSPTGN